MKTNKHGVLEFFGLKNTKSEDHNPEKKWHHLVEAIKSGGFQQEMAIKSLCLDRNMEKTVLKIGKRYKFSKEDVEDIYQETLFIFIKNVQNDKFKGISSPKTYIIGIAKNLYLKHLKERQKTHNLNDSNRVEPVDYTTPETIYTKHESQLQLDGLLTQLDEYDKKILYMYMLRYSMQEIAKKMNYKNVQSAKNAVLRSRKKLQLLIYKPCLYGVFHTESINNRLEKINV